MSAFEYRVRWQREGRSRSSQLVQTEQGALAKVARIVQLDEDKRDPDHDRGQTHAQFGDMPDLVGPPTIERRPVGEWRSFE